MHELPPNICTINLDADRERFIYKILHFLLLKYNRITWDVPFILSKKILNMDNWTYLY